MATTPVPVQFPLGQSGIQTTDFTKLRPAGVGEDPEITAARDATIRANEDQIKALEERYAQPNWFKIAGAFAKPQLGGFLASLGSAADVLGENVESQRAIAPTIAQMRAQTSVGREGLVQRTKAYTLLNERKNKPGGLTSKDVADIASYDEDVGKNAQQTFTNQRGTFADLIKGIEANTPLSKLKADLGEEFVNANYEYIRRLVPGISGGAPSPTEKTTPSTTPSDKEGTTSRPLGVPEKLVSGVTKTQELSTTSAQIAERMKDVEALQKQYGQQSTSALPIYNTAAEIYTLGSREYMKPAFAVFEKGDPMGILGKALEAQQVSNVMAKMRDQITTSRMNKSDKASAMSDLQAMELSLGALQTQIQNGIINPTDARTMFEAASVPGAKNSQDAFLRGIARIGSDALGKYEVNNVFNQFLNRKDADIKEWQKSPEFIAVQNNLKKRTQQAITNVASSEVPTFLKSGIESAYKYQPVSQTQSSKTSTNTGGHDEASVAAEMKKRGLLKP
jgi:hypothetical protein